MPYNGAEGFPTNITLTGFLDLPSQPQSEVSQTSSAVASNACGVCETECDPVKCFHCDKVVCPSCKSSHTGQLKLDIGRLVNQIRRGLPRLSNAIGDIEQKSEQTKQYVEGVKSEVRNTVERYIKELREREKMLTSELETFQQGELRSLRLQQESLEVELASISSYCDSTETLLSQTEGSTNPPESDLVSMRRQCGEYMDQIRNLEAPSLPPTRHVSFTYSGQSLHSSISGFGEISIQNPNQRSPAQEPSPQQSEPSRRRDNSARSHWSDRPPLDTALLESLRVSPAVGSSRDYTRSQNPPRRAASIPPLDVTERFHQGNDRHSSVPFRPQNLPGYYEGAEEFWDPPRPNEVVPRPNPSVRTHNVLAREVPARYRDYMFALSDPAHRPVAAERQQRHQEARMNSERNQRSSLFGEENRWERDEGRLGGLMGGGAPERPRGRATQSTSNLNGNRANSNSSPNAVSRGNRETAQADPAPRRVEQRPAAAFVVSLNGGSIQELTRQREAATSVEEVESTDSGSVSQSPNAESSSEVTENATGAGSNVTSAGQVEVPREDGNTNGEQQDEANRQPTESTPATSEALSTDVGGNHASEGQSERSEQGQETAAAEAVNSSNNSDSNQNRGGESQPVEERQNQPDSNAAVGTAQAASRSQRGSQAPAAGRGNRNRGQGRNQGDRGRSNHANQTSRQSDRSNATEGRTQNTTERNTRQRGSTQRERPQRNTGRSSTSRRATPRGASGPAQPDSGRGTASNDSNRTSVASSNDSVDSGVGGSTVLAPPGVERSRTFVREDGQSTSGQLPQANESGSASQATNASGVSDPVSMGDLVTEADVVTEPRSESLTVSRPANRYKSKGQMVLQIGQERSNTQGNFTWPRGVAVSPANSQIVVADSSNHRVQIFDQRGQFVRTFGSYGQGDGEFDCLAGVAITTSGNIVIADRYNHRIQVFDATGNFVRKFGEEGSADGQLNYPWGVGTDGDRNIYVCDKENNRVQVYDIGGRFLSKIGSLGSRPGQLENPHYVCVSGDGNVVVSDSGNHRLQVFNSNGRFLRTIGTEGTGRGQLKSPRGVAVDRQGFIVVADGGNNRVQVFRADGRYFCTFGSWGTEPGKFKGMEGVALSESGLVVVTDKENHRIQCF